MKKYCTLFNWTYYRLNQAARHCKKHNAIDSISSKSIFILVVFLVFWGVSLDLYQNYKTNLFIFQHSFLLFFDYFSLLSFLFFSFALKSIPHY